MHSEIDEVAYGAAFGCWLRTGRWPRAAPVEHKFNPYHDPRNGRFTFAPGGAGSGGDDDFSDVRRGERRRGSGGGSGGSASGGRDTGEARRVDAVYRPRPGGAAPILVQRGPRMGRGGNSRAFEDPMTLAQVFPGLRDRPGGAIIGLVDNVFDLTGPANRLNAELSAARVSQLIGEIQSIDPRYRLDTLGFPRTVEGLARQINDLRLTRAAMILRVKGDPQPLQVETLRFGQAVTDAAYARGKQLIKAGTLRVTISEPLTLGNYVDRQFRIELRERYKTLGVDSGGSGPVRVNRREVDANDERIYRRPDARVGDVAFDVTLSLKTLKTAQVRGFFGAAFRPTSVVIIRPSQLGPESSYVIPRPKVKQ